MLTAYTTSEIHNPEWKNFTFNDLEKKYHLTQPNLTFDQYMLYFDKLQLDFNCNPTYININQPIDTNSYLTTIPLPKPYKYSTALTSNSPDSTEINPTNQPINPLQQKPTNQRTYNKPMNQPTNQPTNLPTNQPSSQPTTQPSTTNPLQIYIRFYHGPTVNK